jgi:hypothetical protein
MTVITLKHVGAVLMYILILLLKQFSCASVGNKTLITLIVCLSYDGTINIHSCYHILQYVGAYCLLGFMALKSDDYLPQFLDNLFPPTPLP